MVKVRFKNTTYFFKYLNEFFEILEQQSQVFYGGCYCYNKTDATTKLQGYILKNNKIKFKIFYNNNYNYYDIIDTLHK